MKKEEAYKDYMMMIKHSWTWAKLTEDEKQQFEYWLDSWNENGKIKGTYQARWEMMQMFWTMFLSGCGYRGGKFREK